MKCTFIRLGRLLRSEAGQGTSEMVFILPLFALLAAGAIFVSYMCWQGIKVQEAANVGARIAGQETVGGAKDLATILQDNGLVTSFNVNAAGDPDPSACNQTDPVQKQTCLKKLINDNGSGGNGFMGTKLDGAAGGAPGVYWSFRRLVYNLFSAGEQKNLFVPAPQTRGGITEVKVNRVMRAPKIFGWQPPVVSIEGKAYGGEDTYQYALPRFGHTNGMTGPNSNLPFWQQVFLNDSSLKADTQNQ